MCFAITKLLWSFTFIPQYPRYSSRPPQRGTNIVAVFRLSRIWVVDSFETWELPENHRFYPEISLGVISKFTTYLCKLVVCRSHWWFTIKWLNSSMLPEWTNVRSFPCNAAKHCISMAKEGFEEGGLWYTWQLPSPDWKPSPGASSFQKS